MGLKGSIREYELKFRYAKSLNNAVSLIKKHFNIIKQDEGTSTDYYWKAINKKTADFIRLRSLDQTHGEITVKHTDKKGISDRFEVDLPVGSPTHANKLLSRYLGPHTGEIKKHYVVLFLDSRDSNISVYQVKKDNAVYVEIECYNLAKTKEIASQLKEVLDLIPENKSLFNIYINV